MPLASVAPLARAAGVSTGSRRAGAHGIVVRSRWAGLARLTAVLGALLLVGVGGSVAQAQMPDLSQMSGQPLPSGDLPAGSVSVRVVRGSISNNVANQDVTLEGGGPAQTVKTDASGRATFSGLAPNSVWRARATVDGERLESQALTIPSAGGIRVLLAAGVKAGQSAAAAPSAEAGTPASGAGASAGQAQAPAGAGQSGQSSSPAPSVSGGAPSASAVPGTVAFSQQSRIVIELAEGSLEVYGLFDIVNVTSTPVMPAAPVVFESPAEASITNVLDGSSPQAKAEGHRVTVTGPFAPGNTSVQVAYRLPYSGGTVHLSQVVPLGLPQITVIVRKFGELRATLEGVTGQREVPLEGRQYLVLNGKALKPGERVALTLTGLPHPPAWPRYTALGLAALIVIAGVVFAFRTPRGGDELDDEQRTQRGRRAAAFEQLVTLERRLRQAEAGGRAPDDGLWTRRAALIDEIATLDGELDVESSPIATSASLTTGGVSGSSDSPDAERAEGLGARPAVR